MTDEPAREPARHEDVASDRARVDSPARRRRWDLLPVLYLVGFAVLAGALLYLYQQPAMRRNPEQEAGRVDTLQDQVRRLTSRINQVESRPATPASAQSPELAALQTRIAEMDRHLSELANQRAGAQADPTQLQGRLEEVQRQVNALAAGAQGGGSVPPTEISALADRVNQLASRPSPAPVDLAPLTARIERVENRPPPDLAPLGARIDALEARGREVAQQLTGKLDAVGKSVDEINAKTDSLQSRLTAVEAQGKQNASALNQVAERAQRAGRLQTVSALLQSGQPLGDVPGAPPALARFAHQPPPTEASLRLSFNQYAEAAQRASQPAVMDNQPFATRLWNRAQQVVTVRQGDRVLLGDPIAGVIAHAREAVEAGDLKGAVAALDGLAGPAAAAMKPWVDQARALLDARGAIASMAEG